MTASYTIVYDLERTTIGDNQIPGFRTRPLMPDPTSHDNLRSLVERILKGELDRATVPREADPPIIVVTATRTSEGHRTDGLREDAKIDAGFSFAVAEGCIDIAREFVNPVQFERIHRVLWEAGTDDWMDYSQLNYFEAADVPAQARLMLTFSSAPKAATIIQSLLEALR